MSHPKDFIGSVAAATAAVIVVAAGEENDDKDDQPNPVVVKQIAETVIHNCAS